NLIQILNRLAGFCFSHPGCCSLALLCPCYFVATFTPLRPFASIAFCTTPVCFASSTSVASRCGAFFRLAAHAPRAATRSRRRAWLRIFVVRCGLPCDPPVGGLSCNGGMIPRFHRAVVDWVRYFSGRPVDPAERLVVHATA